MDSKIRPAENRIGLSKEDYEEPCCPLSRPTKVTSVPIGRIVDKLDEHLGRNDYDAAQRHLQYWLAEAEAGYDQRGMLSLLNEQIGLYRKMDKKAEGLAAIEEALTLADTLGMENSLTLGTTLLNAATGCKAFGNAERALSLYRRAQTIYESLLPPDDARLGGLYNNMALALTELGSYQEAETLFRRAIDIMAKQDHGESEMAISFCNLADLICAKDGAAEGDARIRDCLDAAEKLLNTESLPRDGYYAFVCEKCASTFGYYGYFMTEEILNERARTIYERA